MILFSVRSTPFRLVYYIIMREFNMIISRNLYAEFVYIKQKNRQPRMISARGSCRLLIYGL